MRCGGRRRWTLRISWLTNGITRHLEIHSPSSFKDENSSSEREDKRISLNTIPHRGGQRRWSELEWASIWSLGRLLWGRGVWECGVSHTPPPPCLGGVTSRRAVKVSTIPLHTKHTLACTAFRHQGTTCEQELRRFMRQVQLRNKNESTAHFLEQKAARSPGCNDSAALEELRGGITVLGRLGD